MTPSPEQDRLLIVAPDLERQLLAELFATGGVTGWEVREAEDFAGASTILEEGPCEVLLIDHGIYQPGPDDELMRLRAGREIAAVFLAGTDPEQLTRALETGVQQWLPRELALRQPSVLQAVLNQALRWTYLARHSRLAGEALHDSRRQVARLVSLLWETKPIDPRTRWFTQHHTMERFEEEVARAVRYGTPLAVVRGEILAASAGESASPEATLLSTWISNRIASARRRSDVVGHYGTNGFLLLLPHTEAAGAISCCRRLKMLLDASPNPLRTCFGIANLSPHAPTVRALLSRAEECLEKARTTGSDPVVS